MSNRTVALTSVAGGLIGLVGGIAIGGPQNMVVAGMVGGAAGIAGGAYLGKMFSDRNGRSGGEVQPPAQGQGQNPQAQGQGQSQNLGDSAMQALNSQPVQALTGLVRAATGTGAPGAGPGGIPTIPRQNGLF
ncbi:MAG: hypothetical protein K2Q01_05570 [Rickettsiales bacterium]|nr:hypothetical protein [Rickettsiales bacterium]